MAILGIIGNGLVILVYAKNRKMRSTTNGLLVGLAAADLLTSILLIPIPQLLTVPMDWRGHLYCKIVYSSVIMWILIVVSIFTLTMVSFERYLAISYPIRYRMVFSKSRPKYIMLGIWIIAICINLFSFFISFNNNGQCMVIWPSPQFQACWGTLLFFIEYFIPMIIMIVTHVGTILGLRKQARELISRNESPNSPAYALLQARRKVIEMLLIVVITFVICWSPDQFAFLAFNLGFVPVRYLYGTLYQVFVLLAFFNSCCNPIIYAFKNAKFRTALKKIFTGKFLEWLSATDNVPDVNTRDDYQQRVHDNGDVTTTNGAELERVQPAVSQSTLVSSTEEQNI
ncbi:allatostatin-A receptor-like [Amphiura filiformis]|uniref:allatostatin-A receptor-like n=1 Tax=Amphiura filiformis TaxID=82378 RepID=UPI003B20C4D9